MARTFLTPFRGSRFGADPFQMLHREMNRLFDDVFQGMPGSQTPGQAGGGNANNFIEMNMNVSETENEIRVTAELPGVTEQDIEVRLDDEILSIRAEKKFEQGQGSGKENFHFVERAYGTFQRSLRLPSSVNPDQISAHFENGVLSVSVPKAAQQERSHKIQVSSSRPKLEERRDSAEQEAGTQRSNTQEPQHAATKPAEIQH